MSAPGLDPERWLEAHGDVLYRSALGRVTHPDVAEDLVQETLLAAWRNRDSFFGKASERTWLIGILQHKAVDYLRRAGRRNEVNEASPAEGGGIERTLFDGNGRWRVRPILWGDEPLALNEAEAFMEAFGGCLEELPPRLRDVFTMREIDDLDVAQVSGLLDVSANHLYVLLHRARLALRRCLEVKWFARP